MDPRHLAASVVERVIEQQAFAAAALDATLRRYPQLEERQRALTTELVYTTLRAQRVLEARLTALAPRGLPRDSALRAHLYVAAAQLLLFDRVPRPMAVDRAVSGIDAIRGPRVAGFANALLRKLAADTARLDRTAVYGATCPEWLRERLLAAVGPEEVDALLGHARDSESSEPRPVTLRLSATRAVPAFIADAPRGRFSPLARVVRGAGDLRRLDSWKDGSFTIQEEGAQLSALGLGARSGERVLDACAGRGQKTTLLAEQVSPEGVVHATDIHPRKLEALELELVRLGLSGVETALVDWSRGGGGLPQGFDRALVDAPCSGTGTLARRPDIALRLDPGDPERLGRLAASILRNVTNHVRSGGRVVYVVCSVLKEEAETVVSSVEDVLEPVPFEAPEVVAALGPGVAAGRLLPVAHGTDGYFLASFRRR